MDWLIVAQSLGIPVMCLVALAFAVWKALIWAAQNIIQPLAIKHMDFIDRVAGSVDSMTGSMKQLGEARTKELTTTEGIADKLDHITQRLEKTLEAITDVKGVIIRTHTVSVVPGDRGGSSHDPRSG